MVQADLFRKAECVSVYSETQTKRNEFNCAAYVLFDWVNIKI